MKVNVVPIIFLATVILSLMVVGKYKNVLPMPLILKLRATSTTVNKIGTSIKCVRLISSPKRRGDGCATYILAVAV